MNDEPRQKLRELIVEYGRSLCNDPNRCEALLKDYCGIHKREIFVLVSALKKGVTDDMLMSSTGVPQELVMVRLRKRLEDELAMTDEAAHWAVDSWALALGFITVPSPETNPNSLPRGIPIVPKVASTVVRPMATINQGANANAKFEGGKVEPNKTPLQRNFLVSNTSAEDGQWEVQRIKKDVADLYMDARVVEAQSKANESVFQPTILRNKSPEEIAEKTAIYENNLTKYRERISKIERDIPDLKARVFSLVTQGKMSQKDGDSTLDRITSATNKFRSV